MTVTTVCLLVIGSMAAGDVASNNTTATVVGSAASVAYVRRDDVLLLDVAAAANAFGWKASIVAPDRLLSICRDKPIASCVPIRLDGVKTATVDGRLFVAATVVAAALHLQLNDTNGQVSLRSATTPQSDGVPAYNAAWPAGRGFHVGDRLPDIPLLDMQGREVRFSRFLGKQYILYCWASW